MFGTVTKYFREKGYGFIRGEDGKSQKTGSHTLFIRLN